MKFNTHLQNNQGILGYRINILRSFQEMSYSVKNNNNGKTKTYLSAKYNKSLHFIRTKIM